jgi:hypothetical protein
MARPPPASAPASTSVAMNLLAESNGTTSMRRARGIRLALHRDDLERALGRLADQGPAAAIGANDLGVVAEVGDGQKRGEVAPARRRDLAGRVVAEPETS